MIIKELGGLLGKGVERRVEVVGHEQDDALAGPEDGAWTFARHRDRNEADRRVVVARDDDVLAAERLIDQRREPTGCVANGHAEGLVLRWGHGE